jgi:hypothetical protein
MTTEFVKWFIIEYAPRQEIQDWLRKADPSDMTALWIALLDENQDASIEAAKRVIWALWVLNVTNNPLALGEITWCFANDAYSKTSYALKRDMVKIRRFFDGDYMVDLEKVKQNLYRVSDTTRAVADAAWSAYMAAEAARAAEDAENIARSAHGNQAADAEDDAWEARMTMRDEVEAVARAALKAALAVANEQSVYKDQLEIIRKTLVKRGLLS